MQHGGGRVLVTGGAGFIGSHVAGAYLRAGYEVVVLDSLVHGRREQVPEGAEFVHADIRSIEAARLIRSRGFDVISHHAAQVSVSRSVADPRFDASVNVDGLLNLLGAAAEAGVRRIQYVSSAAVYGPAGGAATRETAPKNPETPYGVSKLAGEQYLYYYHRVHGLDYVAMRYANVYGPRQDPHGEAGVVAIYSARLQSGEPVSVFGDGEQTRDFVYVGDVAEANVLLASVRLPAAASLDDRAFNVGTGRQTSVNHLAETFMEVSGVRVPRQHLPERPGDVLRSGLDATRLGRLGWSPRTHLADGLEALWEHVQCDLVMA